MNWEKLGFRVKVNFTKLESESNPSFSKSKVYILSTTPGELINENYLRVPNANLSSSWFFSIFKIQRDLILLVESVPVGRNIRCDSSEPMILSQKRSYWRFKFWEEETCSPMKLCFHASKPRTNKGVLIIFPNFLGDKPPTDAPEL